MSRLIRLACEALRDNLAAAVPQARTVVAMQQPPDIEVAYPVLAIIPEAFKLTTQNPEEVEDANGDPVFIGGSQRAILEVGALRGAVQIHVGSREPAQRERMEDAIFARFMLEDVAIGRLLLQLANVEIGGEKTGVDWPIAFIVDSSEWKEELVFSEKRWSHLRVLIDIPILVAREESWPVQQLIVALSHDLSVTVTDPTQFSSPPLADLRFNTVDDDGSVGPPP